MSQTIPPAKVSGLLFLCRGGVLSQYLGLLCSVPLCQPPRRQLQYEFRALTPSVSPGGASALGIITAESFFTRSLWQGLLGEPEL